MNTSSARKLSGSCICQGHSYLLNKQYTQDLVSPHLDKAAFEKYLFSYSNRQECAISLPFKEGIRRMSWLLYLIVGICRNTFTLPPPLRLKAFQEEVSIVFQ